jgi:branched-chain amino acid aminotransferase
MTPAELLVYMNGKLVPRGEARISVFDASFQSGDNVWEGIRVYNGKVFKLHEHINRLFDSAKELDIPIRLSPSEIEEAVFATLRANRLFDETHIRLILTRGERRTSGMNPKFVTSDPSLVIIAERKPPIFDKKGIRLVTSSLRRPTPDSLNPQVHHGNQLNSILAKIEANRAGADDAVMLDHYGFVAEANSTNLFLVKDGEISTPFPTACLPGITRATVIREARLAGIPTVERNIALAELHVADEVFATGTIAEVVPVIEIDGRQIGQGVPGPVTLRVSDLYRRLTETQGVEIPQQAS